MPILLKLFCLLINIDQETILNFFGIQDPNNFGDASYSSLNELAPISTEVSFGTIKLIFAGLLERYQDGLGLTDIENIILFITFVRFIILALKYNIKTSFYICCIGLVAGGLWYFHLKDLFLWYRDVLLVNRLTSKFVFEARSAEISEQVTRIGSDKGFNSPINFLKYAFVEAGKRPGGYQIDPISMVFTQVPETLKAQTDKFYYAVFGRIVPTVWAFLTEQVVEYIPIITYLVVVRLNKKYCPYLIRWHWTFLWTFSVIENTFISLVRRLQFYLFQIVLPEDKYLEQPIILGLLVGILLIHFLVVIFGLLHATCGQYFYFPFITENAEVHIGPRPQNSIYSGGYTAWQNNKDKRIKWIIGGGKNSWQLYVPRLWWGWFGRGASVLDNDSRYKEREYRKKRRKRFVEKRRKRFNKLIRNLEKWIFNN